MPLTATDTPIDHLPPELLLEIFLIYQSIIQKQSDKYFDRRWEHNYCWIRVTHVCRRWRETALEFPPLWTSIYIPAAQPDWVDELIRRSQSIPLSMLSMRLSGHVIKRATAHLHSLTQFLGHDTLTPSMKRLQICLSFYDATWKEIRISDFSPSVLSNLEELTFQSYGGGENNRPLIQYFATHLPPLRSLALRGCAWDRTMFQDSLKDLSICTPHGDVTWGEFCSVLSKLKNLEHLELGYLLQGLRRSPANDTVEYSFHYPRLRTLSLEGDRPDEYAAFLSQVSFPHTTYLDIDAVVYKDKDSLPSLLDVLSQHLLNLPPSDPSETQSLDLTIRLGSVQCFGFHLYTTPPRSRKLIDSLCDLHCNIGARTEQGITKMFASTNPDLLQYIYLLTERFNIPVPLARAIARLPALRTLSIWDYGRSQALSPFRAIDIVSCDCGLSSDPVDSNAASTNGALCQACNSSVGTCFPSLRILEYHGSGDRKLDEEELHLLRRILVVCDIANHKIEVLNLEGWGARDDYSPVSIQELEISCGKLTWIGY